MAKGTQLELQSALGCPGSWRNPKFTFAAHSKPVFLLGSHWHEFSHPHPRICVCFYRLKISVQGTSLLCSLFLPPCGLPYSPLAFLEVDKGRAVSLEYCGSFLLPGSYEVGEIGRNLGAVQVAQCRASVNLAAQVNSR